MIKYISIFTSKALKYCILIVINIWKNVKGDESKKPSKGLNIN